MWERVTEGGSSLNRRERKFPNVVRFVESENSFNLIEIDMLLHFDNIRVQVLDVFNVREDERLFWIKTKSNDILNIVNTHCDCALRSFKLEFWPVDVLLIVGDLNNKRHIKCVL